MAHDGIVRFTDKIPSRVDDRLVHTDGQRVGRKTVRVQLGHPRTEAVDRFMRGPGVRFIGTLAGRPGQQRGTSDCGKNDNCFFYAFHRMTSLT